MSSIDASAIRDQILAHIQQQGGSPSAWYIGIASDIDQRLHGDHAVPRKGHWFIWRLAHTSDDARAIENVFLEWGCDGGPGGGDDSTRYVYAYLKSPVTDP